MSAAHTDNIFRHRFDRFASLAGAAIAGALFQRGFTPTFEWWFPVLGLLGWMFLLERSPSRRHSVLLGLLFGLSWFGLGLQWTVNSMTDHGHLPWLLAEGGVALLALVLSVSPVLTALVLGPRRERPISQFMLSFAGLFTLTEWIRGAAVFNFDWLNPAYLMINTWIAGWAPLGGEFGLLLASLVCAAGVITLIFGRWPERAGAALVCVLLYAVSYWSGHTVWSEKTGEVRVEVMQPDLPIVDAFMRVDPAMRLAELRKGRSFYLAAPEEKPLMALMPEGVVNEPFSRLSGRAETELRSLLEETGVPTFVNAFRMQKRRYFNTTLVLTSDAALGVTDKRHLVPFGEFVPEGARWFINLLGIPMSDVLPGAPDQPALRLGGHNVGLLICYENLFADVLRSYWEHGSGVDFVALTANLGWFGPDIVPQHMQITRLRAMEVARAVVVSSNTGLSSVIGADGRFLQHLAPFGADYAVMTVPVMTGEPTPFVRWGSTPALVIALLLFLVGFLNFRRVRT